MEFGGAGKLNGMLSAANAPLVCTFLVEKPCGIRLRLLTQQSAKHRTARVVYACLAVKTFGIRPSRETQQNAKPQMHLQCALPQRRSHVESVRVG